MLVINILAIFLFNCFLEYLGVVFVKICTSFVPRVPRYKKKLMVWSNFGILWHLMAQNDTSGENLIDNVGHITKKMKKL